MASVYPVFAEIKHAPESLGHTSDRGADPSRKIFDDDARERHFPGGPPPLRLLTLGLLGPGRGRGSPTAARPPGPAQRAVRLRVRRTLLRQRARRRADRTARARSR